jgi:hypothetical protein
MHNLLRNTSGKPFCLSLCRRNWDLLIDAGVTGITAGIENNTISNAVHNTANILIGNPQRPRLNGASAISFLPFAREMAMGIA